MMSRADIAMANAYIPGAKTLPQETEQMIGKREALLGPAYRLMYQEPLHFVKGEGAWLIAADGRRYLDAYNNVTSLGHCHPHVVQAIARQAATLATNTRYIQDGILALAEKLLATMPAAARRSATAARSATLSSISAGTAGSPGATSMTAPFTSTTASWHWPRNCWPPCPPNRAI